MAYKLVNSEDVVYFGVTALTKRQMKMKVPPKEALTVEAKTLEEAKGVAKGMLEANSKYVYAFVIKVVEGYIDLDWGIKSADIVFDTWYEEETEEDQNDTPGVVH